MDNKQLRKRLEELKARRAGRDERERLEAQIAELEREEKWEGVKKGPLGRIAQGLSKIGKGAIKAGERISKVDVNEAAFGGKKKNGI